MPDIGEQVFVHEVLLGDGQTVLGREPRPELLHNGFLGRSDMLNEVIASGPVLLLPHIVGC